MAETLDGLKVRIRELEKEVERWKSQVKSVRYGLNWMDVPEAFDKDSEDKIPILEEVAEKAVDAEGPLTGKPPHVIIEGDNYHALTCLNYTHRGKIDVIYIDPPYNTGSDGFTYKDKRFLTEFPDGQKVPKEHPLRHSYWLSFMEKRLNLAKKLLRDEGVIFISIDDNEQANLKLLCDKVFGEGNEIGPIIQNKLNAKNDTVNVQKNHEFILCYRKKTTLIKNKVQPSLIDEKIICKNVFVEKGRFFYLNDAITTRGEGGTLNARPNLGYTVYYNPKTKDKMGVIDYDVALAKESNDASKIYKDDENLISQGYEIIRPPKVRGKLGCWTWEVEKFNAQKDEIIVTGKKGKYSVHKRTFVEQNDVSEIDGELRYQAVSKANVKSIWNYSTNDGTNELTDLFAGNVFNNPKNLDMIMYIIRISSELIKDHPPVILDFFAGSGTTLHATMNLNKVDERNRQCILVQSPEKTYSVKDGKEFPIKGCEVAFEKGFRCISEITYERNRRVMCGYTNAKGESVDGLGGSLKYYKTCFVGKHQSKNANDADKVELAEKAGCLIALAENTLETINVPKAAKGFWQIYSDNAEKKKRYTCIYHNGDYGKVPDFVAKIDELRATDKKSKFTVYVFSWNSPDFFENEFDDLKNIEIKAIPKPILEIYKALNG